jgi:uncharacterized protein
MKQRLSVLTLGVADLQRARDFYEALGWRSDSGPDIGVVFFQSGDMVLSLWDRDLLAKDSGVQFASGCANVTLAHNVASEADVDAVLEEARAAGATVTRAGAPTFWGGYSGAFLDLDGHPWEIAHNPHWALSEGGGVTLSA